MYINMADQVDGESGSSGNKLCPGIIYLSKIPPFMKPSKIRNIFSQYGEVGRLYLQVEGIAIRFILQFQIINHLRLSLIPLSIDPDHV